MTRLEKAARRAVEHLITEEGKNDPVSLARVDERNKIFPEPIFKVYGKLDVQRRENTSLTKITGCVVVFESHNASSSKSSSGELAKGSPRRVSSGELAKGSPRRVCVWCVCVKYVRVSVQAR